MHHASSTAARSWAGRDEFDSIANPIRRQAIVRTSIPDGTGRRTPRKHRASG
ncbi:hypothetical protein P355_1136 [Burkholderia cenocepacia KC-01]|nr:hypothetical protein P355_1136 [Burkholderia cenocepacia KC-01]